MAVIAPTRLDVSIRGDGSAIMISWTPVTQADTCAPVAMPEHSDRSVHVSGTFGGSSTAITGSNNGGASFTPLRDPSSTVIAIIAEGIRAVLENSGQIAPLTTGGTAQSLRIDMLFRMTNPLRT